MEAIFFCDLYTCITFSVNVNGNNVFRKFIPIVWLSLLKKRPVMDDSSSDEDTEKTDATKSEVRTLCCFYAPFRRKWGKLLYTSLSVCYIQHCPINN